MTKKITHNSIQSIWRSGLLAFALLLSMTTNSQVVGQEYVNNAGINSAAQGGVGNGNGGMSASNNAGWTEWNSVAYIDSGGTDGSCHSEDRQFRLYKKGGEAGQYVTQVISLPAGNFNWSFWTKWGAMVDYDSGVAEKPTFEILTDDDSNGTWDVVQTTITTQPSATHTWVQQTGTYNNNTSRNVKIKFFKYGGTNANQTNLNQLMFVDDVSLNYSGVYTYPVNDTSLVTLTQDGATIAGFTESKTTYDISLAQGTTVVPTIAATTNNPSASLVITDAGGIPGTTTIVITAEDGTTTNTVSINFSISEDIAVGQEFLVNPNINTTATSPDTGVDGGGNFPILGGWGFGASGSYAPTSAVNGDCHSEDRMFKLFKKNGDDGQYVTQTVTLPAGTYNWSFWTKWGATVDYDAGDAKKPTFKIMTDDDANGTWSAVQTTITTQPTTAETWVEQTGTFMNNIEREVKIKFHKNGGVSNAETNLNQLMYIDDVSLKYASAVTTWTGNGDTNTDWDTATNWSNGVPVAGVTAVVPNLTNDPIATGDITLLGMVIESDASLSVTGAVNNTDVITMYSGASLIAKTSVSENITYNRNLATTNWYLISSPVVGQNVDDFVAVSALQASLINVPNIALGTAYNTIDDTWAYYQDGASTANTFNAGQGYSINLEGASGDISFTGTMNVSDESKTLAITGNGYNLLGNPYPSYVNSSAMLTASTGSILTETIWVWDQSLSGGAGGYATKTSIENFQLAPGQGFFVQSNGSAGSVAINEAFQNHQGTDTFLKINLRPEVHVTLNDGTNEMLAKLYYIDGASKGFDNGFDGPMFGGVSNSLAVYTHSLENGLGRNLAIQSLPNNDFENLIVPIGVKALSGKEITFSANTLNFPDGINVYLEDKNDSSFTLLNDSSNFMTTLSSDLNGIGRFYLHTKSSVLNTNEVTLENISIYKTDNTTLRIVGLSQGKTAVKLFNILGKQVLNSSFISNGVKDISLPKLASGVYIVQLETENGKLNRKIILE